MQVGYDPDPLIVPGPPRASQLAPPGLPGERERGPGLAEAGAACRLWAAERLIERMSQSSTGAAWQAWLQPPLTVSTRVIVRKQMGGSARSSGSFPLASRARQAAVRSSMRRAGVSGILAALWGDQEATKVGQDGGWSARWARAWQGLIFQRQPDRGRHETEISAACPNPSSLASSLDQGTSGTPRAEVQGGRGAGCRRSPGCSAELPQEARVPVRQVQTLASQLLGYMN